MSLTVTCDSLIDTHEKLREEVKRENDLRHELNLELMQKTCDFQLKLRLGEQESQVQRLTEQAKLEKSEATNRKSELLLRTEALSRRKEKLKTAGTILDQNSNSMNIQKGQIGRLKLDRTDLYKELYNRRAELLRSLEVIFPIELIDASTLLFTINGLALPNQLSDERNSLSSRNDTARVAEKEALTSSHSKFQKIDEESVASALGLVAQLVTLLSHYLSTPIHYPIATAGSRAVILDGISVMSGPRTFPLYSKGVETYRFEYAVFLLNKDIEQLMNTHDITMLDLKATLPNLKNLMLTLTAKDANHDSHMSRKRMIGKKEILMKSEKELEKTPMDQAGLGRGLPSINGTNGSNSPSFSTNGRSDQTGMETTDDVKSSQKATASVISSGWGSSLFSGWRGSSNSTAKLNEDKKREDQNQQSYPIVRRLG